ncbi:MAG: hypothetical protein DMF70_11660 [Acidobacteria bacterium]|nr:MAG: hypothetical protein DMF70_11660 [Acidobacteriota bacterium]
MKRNEKGSRKGAKAQSKTVMPTWPLRSLRSVSISARLCVFAPLREIRMSRSTAVAIFMIVLWSLVSPVVSAQSPNATTAQPQSLLSRYLDQTNGTTADSAVAYALAHNGELQAARKEIDAARAMVKQARLRANPKVDIGVAQNIIGTDHNVDVGGMLPLELGGRRPARIAVAEREVEGRRTGSGSTRARSCQSRTAARFRSTPEVRRGFGSIA